MQSTIGNTYKKAKEFLDSGRAVLFTGTPCQIGGLYSFLSKNYDNLFTQDIICHGVPSPKAWQKYVCFRENRAKASARRISFTDKLLGWKLYSISFFFDNNTEYRQTLSRDLSMIAFLKNANLRLSCHNCSFKNINRQSDITLAGFWGIENVFPDMDDDKGTSLLILNSKKGKEIFSQIQEKIIYKKTDLLEAVEYNPAMIKSVLPHKNREKFLSSIETVDFEKAVKKYCLPTLVSKIFNFSRRVLRKIKKIICK